MIDPDPCLVRAILAEPDDSSARLVLSDWLEERDDPRADWLRVVTQTLAQAGPMRTEPRPECDPAKVFAEPWYKVIRKYYHEKSQGWPFLTLEHLMPENGPYETQRRNGLLRLYGMAVVRDLLLRRSDYYDMLRVQDVRPYVGPCLALAELYACRMLSKHDYFWQPWFKARGWHINTRFYGQDRVSSVTGSHPASAVDCLFAGPGGRSLLAAGHIRREESRMNLLHDAIPSEAVMRANYALSLSRQFDLADAYRAVITPLWDNVAWVQTPRRAERNRAYAATRP